MAEQWKVLENTDSMGYWRFIWLYWLARLRLSKYAVCVMSRNKGAYDDCHDYHDSEEGYPDHFALLTCKRCGKRFYI